MDFGEKLLVEAKKVNDSFYLFVLLLKQLGLRLNEIRLLKREHITMEDGILCFHILGKGNKARTVYLSPTLSQKVMRMIRTKTGYIFTGRNGPLSRSACHSRIKLLAKRIGKPYFPNLPKKYHFSHNGAAYSIRKENTHDTSKALLNDVLDGIEVISEVIPFAQLFIKTCKNIYDRCQEPGRLRAEIQDFLDFVQLLEKSIIKGLKIFQETEPLRIINAALMKGIKTIDASQKRTGFMAWWNAKIDRETIIEIKGEIMETMKIAQFT
eukprot:g52.t1